MAEGIACAKCPQPARSRWGAHFVYAGVMAESIDPGITAHVAALAGAARVASRRLALLTRAEKDEALLAMADALDTASEEIIVANDGDIARGRAEGLAEGLLERLRMDLPRVQAVAQALRDISSLPDPVGEVVRGSTLANGLQIRQLRVPMGVRAMIYDARPNVPVDAAGRAPPSGTPRARGDCGGDPGLCVDQGSRTGIGHHWAPCVGHRGADIRAAASLLGIEHRQVVLS